MQQEDTFPYKVTVIKGESDRVDEGNAERPFTQAVPPRVHVHARPGHEDDEKWQLN